MYSISTFYPSVARFTKRTAVTAFVWVILSAIWRLMLGILPFHTNISAPIYKVEIPHIIFGTASIALVFLMIFLNQVLNVFQKQESIGTGGSPLTIIYVIIHLLGATLIIVGIYLVSLVELMGLVPPPEFLWIFFGFLLKWIVVPIMGIIIFSGIRSSFLTIED